MANRRMMRDEAIEESIDLLRDDSPITNEDLDYLEWKDSLYDSIIDDDLPWDDDDYIDDEDFIKELY